MSRVLLLDDGLPRTLAAELTARGRPARGVRGVHGRLLDGELLASVAAAGEVLVTTDATLAREHPRSGATLAIVHVQDEAAKREAIHRWAHRMATQPPGSTRHYRRDREGT